MPEFRRDPITGRWVIIDQSRKFNKLTTSERIYILKILQNVLFVKEMKL